MIFPYLAGNTTLSFSRKSGPGYSGTQLIFNEELSDYIFTSEGSGTSGESVEAIYQVLTFGAKSVYVRIVNDDILNYFTRKGTSNSIYYPGMEHIILDNPRAEVIERGSDWLIINIPAGSYHFQIGSPHSVSIQNSEIIGSKGDYFTNDLRA